ncbi:MAG: hypothetical protein RMJ56_09490 [Gemmataceae bacterium]|nr:hypothetical protein [Gemmata sp.]MDW8197822.1 hypothetical protein [Gemmataceae bacterium]
MTNLLPRKEFTIMRVDICTREDEATQLALLDALATLGARAEADSPLEVPLPHGLHRFNVGFDTLTVFADAWLVDLEGPDELVNKVLELIAAAGRG